MTIYHEITKESLESVLRDGLVCHTSGSKSDDLILKTMFFSMPTHHHLFKRQACNVRVVSTDM